MSDSVVAARKSVVVGGSGRSRGCRWRGVHGHTPGGPHAAAPATQTTRRVPAATTDVPPTSSVVLQGRLSHGCVVFRRGGPDGGLHVLGASGTPRRLTTVEGDFLPWWSPDGTMVTFERENGDQQLWVIDSRGSGLRRLTVGRSDGSPTWSPDGPRLLFYREEQAVARTSTRWRPTAPVYDVSLSAIGTTGLPHGLRIVRASHSSVPILRATSGSMSSAPNGSARRRYRESYAGGVAQVVA